MVEGLFIGLIMLCLDSTVCGGEKAILINATEEYCGSTGCTVCTDYNIAPHRPRLYFHIRDLEFGSAPIVRCASPFCSNGVYYWDLLGREICFSVGNQTPTQEPGRPLGANEPSQKISNKAFDWIPSVTRFNTSFKIDISLVPGDRKPVAATVDLGPGHLRAERLSKLNENPIAYSHWLPEPNTNANNDDFPRSLAEAAVWQVKLDAQFLTISDCKDPGVSIMLNRSEAARFIISNLPEPCRPTFGLSKMVLPHFGAYYELDPQLPCSIPKQQGTAATVVKMFDFEEWLRTGNFSSISCPPGTIETTLCPPSKFP